MTLRRAPQFLVMFSIAAGLASSIAFTHTHAESYRERHPIQITGSSAGLAITRSGGATAAVMFSSATPTALSPTPMVTPVTPLPPADSPSSSADSVNNTGKYAVIVIVLSVMTIVIAALVLLWFVVD